MGEPKEAPKEEASPAVSPPKEEPKPVPKEETMKEGQFTMTLRKSTSPSPRLGIDVDLSDGATLLVESLQAEGMVIEWNKNQKDDVTRMKPGDKIISVNAAFGEAKAMTDVIKQDDTLEMVVLKGQA